METTQFSFAKNIYKGFMYLLIGLGSIATITGFYDVSLWVLLETYLKPILGTLTVGGLYTMLLNWLKIKTALGKKIL